MVDINHPWEAEYRPQNIEDVLGSDDILDKLNGYIQNKSIPNLFFVGEPGTGKTTVAKILARDISGENEYLYISASDKNDINTMRTEVKDYCSSMSMSDLKIVVLDEADFLTASAQALLRHTTEEYQNHCRFILTANYDTKVIKPLKSRFQKFEFVGTNKKEIFKRCATILKDKNIELNQETKNNLKELVLHFYPDIRSTINNLQKFTTETEFNFNKTSLLNNNHVELISLLKEGKVKQIRKNCLGGINDYDSLYKLLYNSILNKELTEDGMKGCEIIVLLAEYQYKHALVTDPEINFMACLIDTYDILNKKG